MAATRRIAGRRGPCPANLRDFGTGNDMIDGLLGEDDAAERQPFFFFKF